MGTKAHRGGVANFSQSKIDLLNKLDFKWVVTLDEAWAAQFEELKRYKEENVSFFFGMNIYVCCPTFVVVLRVVLLRFCCVTLILEIV